MWESSKMLLDASSVYQSVTGNPTTLKAIGTHRKAANTPPKARYCGISRIDIIEQLVEWGIPKVTGTERALRREAVRQSILAHQQDT